MADKENKDFYFQIKGRKDCEYFSGWEWPPILSGKVNATSSKEARALINEMHNHDFPMRLSEKNQGTALYLLTLREIKEHDKNTLELFLEKKCPECETVFRVIDKYNDGHEKYKGRDFCSYACKMLSDDRNRIFVPNSLRKDSATAYIYRILNTKTDMCYIGKTTQPFTLRWYQHFYHGKGTKFHQAICDSELIDWQFSIIEIVKCPEGESPNDYVFSRENHWITHYDSIKNGYNSMGGNKEMDDFDAEPMPESDGEPLTEK